MPEVTIGGETVAIEPITGFKAIRGGRLLSRAASAAPAAFDALAEFEGKYRNANAVIVTPELAKLPNYQREIVDENGDVTYETVWSQEDFDRAGGEIRLPSEPSLFEQVAAVLPVVWDSVEAPLIELVALILSPNQDLAQAEKSGQIDAYLSDKASTILHALTLDEIVGLVTVVATMIGTALGGDAAGEAAAKAAEAVGLNPQTQNSTQTSPSPSHESQVGAAQTSSTDAPTTNSSGL